jgi:hypothetical protein
MELYTREPEPEYDELEVFDYVGHVLRSSNIINQWIEEAGEANNWNEQIQELQRQGFLSGENTTYDPNMS